MSQERLPRLGPLLRRLTEAPGERPVEENLTEIARLASHFYAQSFPIAAPLYADTKLKHRHEDGRHAAPAARGRVRRRHRPYPPRGHQPLSHSSIPARSFSCVSTGAAEPRTDCRASSARSPSSKA